VDVAIVFHDTAPHCANDRSLLLGNETVIPGLCAKTCNIDLQLRQIDHRPWRRFRSLREIG
ncbi:hypothetical protein, partial [Intestinimonas butyriciproducens]|uniref:hypothetical protein n=1 Tax=Intestinimonas butyriciproducens TaxID=1297617 RepID=UPI0034A56576